MNHGQPFCNTIGIDPKGTERHLTWMGGNV